MSVTAWLQCARPSLPVLPTEKFLIVKHFCLSFRGLVFLVHLR